ncbi:MAG: hypothetical protein M3Q77_02120 [Thermoproteota archaeon]|nr:hypothetical protein [Thermoproteota archaeon]
MESIIFSLIYQISIMLIFTTFVFLGGLLSGASAQILPQNSNQNSDSTSVTAPSSTPSLVKNPYGIRITDPTNGAQVFINGTDYFDSTGKRLSVEGFSVSNNGNLTNCDVSIVTNSIFPYQNVNGTGPLGVKDFSKWNYKFNSDYANLHEGSNKITSKLACEGGTAKAYYSVNVTGTKFNGTFPASSTNLALANEGITGNSLPPSSNIAGNFQSNLSSSDINSSSEDLALPVTGIEIASPSNGETIDIDKPININGSSEYPTNYDCEVLVADGNTAGVIAPTSANHSNFKKTKPGGINGTSDFRSWSMVLEPGFNNLKNGSQSLTAKLQCYSPLSSVKFAKVNIVTNTSKPLELKAMDVSIDKTGQGTNQKIIIGVNDASTNDPLVGSAITGSINNNPFSGTSDSLGKYRVTIPSSVIDSGATINVSVSASADGYKIKKTSTTFEGSPAITDETTPPTSDTDNRDVTNNEEDLADKIFDDVQKQLSEQGINIPLPFG